MKKLLSLAIAVAMAASATATVFAADYPTDDDNNVVGTPTIGDGTSASSPAAVVTASTVSKVIKEAASSGKTATVNITATASVPKSVIEKITAPVTFKAPNFTITIDPAMMTEKVDNIECGVKTNAPAAQATFEKFFKEPVATIACAQQGNFGGTVTIDVKPDNLTNIDTSKAIYVYSWNPAKNSYKRVGTAILLKNGQVRINATRGYHLILSNATSFTAK